MNVQMTPKQPYRRDAHCCARRLLLMNLQMTPKQPLCPLLGERGPSPRRTSLLARGVLALVLLLLPLTACRERAQPLQKEKEKPNPLVFRGKLPDLDGQRLDTAPKMLYRSARLSVAQAASILQGFRYQAEITYLLTREQKKIRLRETFQLQQRSDGPFQAKLSNSRKKGYEVIWTGEKLYWRARKRPFRLISEEARDALRWQIRGYGRWRALVAIFGPSLELTRQGTVQKLGRTALRYRIALRNQAAGKPPAQRGTIWAGPLPEKTRGDAANLPRLPLKAKGSLLVDQSSALVLQIRFQGSYRLGHQTTSDATTNVQFSASFTQRGNPTIQPPPKAAQIKQVPVPLDPFGRKKPYFLQPPPSQRRASPRQR